MSLDNPNQLMNINKRIKHWLITLTLILSWCGVAGVIAQYHFQQHLDALIKEQRALSEARAADLADSMRRNVHYLRGISNSLAKVESVKQATAMFGAKVAPSTLPYETRRKVWTANPRLNELSRYLAEVQDNLNVDVVHLVNAAGDTIASSIWDQPGSSIGTNYADREWFQANRAGRLGMQYALGRTTHIAGLYFSTPVMRAGKFSGAMVTKINVENLSFFTTQTDGYLTDQYGVIILAHDKSLEMQALPDAAVFSVTDALKRERYERVQFARLPLKVWGRGEVADLYRHGEDDYPQLRTGLALPELGLTIYVSNDLLAYSRLKNDRLLWFSLLAFVGSALILAFTALMFYLRAMRRSRAVLRDSEDRYRSLIENAPLCVHEIDLQGRFTSMNRSGLAMLRFADEDKVCGMPFLSAVSTQDSGRIAALFQQALKGTACDFEFTTAGDAPLYFKSCFIPLKDADGKVLKLMGMTEDITAFKRAQQGLEENEQRYRTLVEWMPQAIVVHRGGKFIYVNPVAVQLFGADCERDLLGTAILDRIHPDYHQLVLERVKKNAADGLPAPLVEEKYLKLDGTVIDLAVQGTSIVYEDAPAVLAVLSDITAHKQADLLEQQRFNELEGIYGLTNQVSRADSISEIYAIAMDFMLRLLKADRAAIQIFDGDGVMHFTASRGLSETYLTALDGHSPWTREAQDPQALFVADIRQEERFSCYRTQIEAEGIAALGFVPLLQHGHLLGKFMVYFDTPHVFNPGEMQLANTIASHVALAIDNKRAEQQFADMFEFAPDALVMTDMQANIIMLNHQSELLFGYSKQELIGQPIDALIPKGRSDERRDMRQRFLNSAMRPRPLGAMSRKDLRAIAKDGRVFPVEISLSPMHSQNGMVIAAAIRDVSARQQVMEQLMLTARELEQANELVEEERSQLAHRVEERTSQLRIANRAKDSFLATMSHEIRTPLGGLLGMMELLSLTSLDGEQLETLQAARNSGKGLLRIVDDILDWSKIEAGKLQLAPRPATILPLLKGVVATYGQLASAKGIQLRYRYDESLSQAHLFDPLRLSQILNNFTSNAIKFTASGTVEISATLSSQQEGCDEVRFCVKDSGVGIDKEHLARLFQQYEQASPDTARMYGGTGLGLAICRSLAELMEGNISVESTSGVGSSFCFTTLLPIANLATQRDLQLQLARGEEAEVHELVDTNPWHSVDEPISILVVDDHPVNRMLLKQQLEQLGLHADIAAYGIVALALWQTGHYDMLITDCHMPEMDGYELTRCIRDIEAQDGREPTPIVAWTANVMSEEEGRCKAAGMDDVLTKPTELAELQAMLRKWLTRSEQLLQVDEIEIQPEVEAGDADATLADGAVISLELSALNKIAKTRAQQIEMLQEFTLHNRNDIAGLAAALQSGNPSAVSRGAHRIKGASRMVGAMQLAALCASIEQAASYGDMNSARTLAKGLYEANSALENEVARFIDYQRTMPMNRSE